MTQNSSVNIHLIPIRFDIMIGDRFVHTMTVLHPRWKIIDEDKIRQEVINRLPSLKNRKFKMLYDFNKKNIHNSVR